MKIKIHPTVIFRTPKFSYQTALINCWDELKKSISISSGDFYETIKDTDVKDLASLPPKIYFTIWKYYNRAKYRSTPYGDFASFSILNNGIKADAAELVIDEAQKLHSFVDWPYRNELNFNLHQLIENNCQFFANSSFYTTFNGIRYIACTDGVFELAEIDADPFVLSILNAAIKPIRVNDLIINLGLDEQGKLDLFSLLEDMHALQLLFTNYDPNIIGKDYFSRLGIKQTEHLPQYLIAERTVKAGGLDEKLLKSVPALIELLHKILPKTEREALTQFKTRFNKKFEKQEVPLLLALDPEMGIGYDELEQSGQGDDFITQFNIKKTAEVKNDLRTNLLQSLSAQSFQKGETIHLQKLNFEVENPTVPLPNSFSLLMSVADDLLCLDQVGGVTANALTGRFTMASDTMEQFCREIAATEEEANPDVLFFEVAYMVETNVDNVNRRKLLYDSQLTILNFDTSDEPLFLNDILISVKGSDIVLRSAKLNKRLIPRIASAYNYSRSDLSVFRLLCDLQHQGIQTGLSLPLDGIFPDLEYYPRFQYHNILLSKQKWKVEKETFFQGKTPVSVADCRRYLKEIEISRFFKTGASDQTLCFDLESDEDLNGFLQYIQKQKSSYLEEVILPQQSPVNDAAGKPYLAQFVLNLTHSNKVYQGFSANGLVHQDVKRRFLPGKEWLYFEIYCHEQRSDELLVKVIGQFLQAHESQIKLWFFIRYNENGKHLRFRILLNKESEGQALTSSLTDYLGDYLSMGLVSDLQLKTYKREIERYGEDLIESVEAHFNIDSNFVLATLETHADAFSKYNWCAQLADQMQKESVFDAAELRQIVSLISDNFNREHQLDAADFKKLNQQYQKYRNASISEMNVLQLSFFNELAKSFAVLLKKREGAARIKLFGDLMHMHVNRLFNKDQRTNEMVMYYFLLKELQRKKAIG